MKNHFVDVPEMREKKIPIKIHILNLTAEIRIKNQVPRNKYSSFEHCIVHKGAMELAETQLVKLKRYVEQMQCK